MSNTQDYLNELKAYGGYCEDNSCLACNANKESIEACEKLITAIEKDIESKYYLEHHFNDLVIRQDNIKEILRGGA